jgi:hypothetical protein
LAAELNGDETAGLTGKESAVLCGDEGITPLTRGCPGTRW